MSEIETYDVVVVGGGPGGYVAAIRAAQLGLKAAVVEREHLGGICLNWGCIPTKALLRSAEIYHLAQHAEEFGLKIKGIEFDLKKVVSRSRAVSEQLSKGIGHLMKKNKVAVIEGQARINGKGAKLIVQDDKGKKKANIEAKHIILATGARARTLPGIEPDGKHIVTYKDAMTPTDLPKSLLVIGSGAIGIEFASFYNTMGSDVTVVEVVDRILPAEDAEISKFAHKQFEKQGMTIKTQTTVQKTEVTKSGVKVTLESNGKKTEQTVERVILAVGIVGNTEELGLEGTDIKVERGHIVTDEWGATGQDGVYAIGDVTGPPWLAHKASHEAIICVEKLAGVDDVHPMKKENIPGCTYCHPQIASVGLTEAQAKEEGFDIKVGRFPFVGNGKAIALGETEGMVKTIFDSHTGALLGAHMVGAEVTEMIQGYVIGKTMEATELDFMHTIFPHPTLSEMMHESVLDAYNKVLHM